ncbi:asparagine synthase-related protein [Candidatus Electronema sp. JC]|uniref:asparagine synthase-related protein n=1 Tax=Candidatus Electronema sp. JC TaxID=3401570 RepID=UPI003B439E7D
MIPSARLIGIALSGGVDSTTAAALLLEQGFAVQGFFMLLLPESGEHAAKAQAVADQLGIPLHLVDLREEFRQQVIAAFAAACPYSCRCRISGNCKNSQKQQNAVQESLTGLMQEVY